MRNRILIQKALVPYSFDILLASEWFNLRIDYNETVDLFTVTLSRDGEVIVYNEPVIYGFPLFADLYRARTYPVLDIVPFDESEQESDVTFSNFNETVFLTIDQGGDDVEKQ